MRSRGRRPRRSPTDAPRRSALPASRPSRAQHARAPPPLRLAWQGAGRPRFRPHDAPSPPDGEEGAGRGGAGRLWGGGPAESRTPRGNGGGGFSSARCEVRALARPRVEADCRRDVGPVRGPEGRSQSRRHFAPSKLVEGHMDGMDRRDTLPFGYAPKPPRPWPGLRAYLFLRSARPSPPPWRPGFAPPTGREWGWRLKGVGADPLGDRNPIPPQRSRHRGRVDSISQFPSPCKCQIT